jgi:hypothetical protein
MRQIKFGKKIPEHFNPAFASFFEVLGKIPGSFSPGRG